MTRYAWGDGINLGRIDEMPRADKRHRLIVNGELCTEEVDFVDTELKIYRVLLKDKDGSYVHNSVGDVVCEVRFAETMDLQLFTTDDRPD